MFFKKTISNDLTRLIENNPFVDVEEVLLHSDFSVTIRYESNILYRRILKKTEKDSQWFDKIVKYALFNAEPPKKYINLNSIKQIIINSSYFLESCGNKFFNYFINNQNDDSIIQNDILQNYLKETIIKFTSIDNIYNQDPMFAGHFQRFIENFIRRQALDSDEIINYLIPFMVSNIRILAYQQLIITFLCDSYDMISYTTVYKILTCILHRSFIAVKYIYNKKTNKLDIVSIPWEKNIINSMDKFVKYKDIEDAEIEAYLILMSIRKCITEENDIVNYFRDNDFDNGYPLIQSLFYCGTRFLDKSIISIEAFRILDIVFKGSIKMGIKSWKLTENEKKPLSFYTVYLNEMLFFLSQPYNFRERALKFLQPLLICESPVSSMPIHPEFHFSNDFEEEEEEDIDSKVGEGSTSIAYKFSDIKTKTPICKKVIKYKCNDRESFEVAKKGLKELDIHSNISHPCICKLYGINFDERIKIMVDNIQKETNTIALFLEFVDYKLSDILEMQISNTKKTRIVLELAHAMNFLHMHGIMHRNLKIDNIMINKTFETKLVKFYYASDTFSDSTYSLTKEIKELAYISPEMASGKEYDNKTDVYSFGVVMYEIFIGKPPMQSLDDKIKGKEVKLPHPSSCISKFCINLIQRCLSYSSSKRPSFNEILNEMRVNSYKLAPGVDSICLCKRDKKLKKYAKLK